MIRIDDDDDGSVINFGKVDDAKWWCAACGEALSEKPGGYADEFDRLACGAYDPDEDPDVDDGETAPDLGEGPHRPQRVPLSWANGATLRVDPDDDSVTVTISIGDPCGAFAFSVRRVPESAPDNAGRLVMHTPHPLEPGLHVGLTEGHAGMYWVG